MPVPPHRPLPLLNPPPHHPTPARPQVQSYKRKIKQLEDDLLFRLSNSQGNLLDDTELIDILASTKQTAQARWGPRWRTGGAGLGAVHWPLAPAPLPHSGLPSAPAPPRPQEVNERLQTASETRRKINDACEEYRPVARRATLLYFLIAEFAGVNCMYQVGMREGLPGQGLAWEGVGGAHKWWPSLAGPARNAACTQCRPSLALPPPLPCSPDLAGPVCGAVRAVHRQQRARGAARQAHRQHH